MKIINNKHNLINKINICQNLDTEIDNILNKKTKHKSILVLSGGGAKGTAHLGVIDELIQRDIFKYIDTFACTSAGALVGVLITCGYSPNNVLDLLTMLGVNKLKSPHIQNLLTDFGFDNGDRFTLVLRKVVEAKGFDANFTFRDHYRKTNKKLIITGTCVNDKKAYYFSVDTFPHMPILVAARISMSVPGYFTPVSYEGKLFLDGGCIDNYPIHLFADKLDQVIGVYVGKNTHEIQKIDHLEGFIINTIDCLLEGSAISSCKSFEKYTIRINIDLSMFEFDLSKDQLYELFNKGKKTAISYLNKLEI
jgi:NTE family protein